MITEKKLDATADSNTIYIKMKPNPCTYSSSRPTGRPNSISKKHSRSPWLP